MDDTAYMGLVTAEVVTAALLNTHLRDQLRETAPFTATTAGDIVYADAANSMNSRVAHPGNARLLVSAASSALAWRQPVEDVDYADASNSQTDSATSLTASWGTSTLPSTGSITTGVAALVLVSARSMSNDTTGASVIIAFAVSGATTIAAGDDTGAAMESDPATTSGSVAVARLVTLTAGSNTFAMQARVTAGNGNINRPRIQVIPF